MAASNAAKQMFIFPDFFNQIGGAISLEISLKLFCNLHKYKLLAVFFWLKQELYSFI